MDEIILANRLAALATVLTDAASAGEAAMSPSAAAALHCLSGGAPRSVQTLATAVGLTHSATVRLVDRLAADGLVRRQARRGREVPVELTVRGRRRAEELARRRLEAAGALLSVISPSERAVLAQALDRMLAVPVDTPETAERICRFCLKDACRGADCPVEQAGVRRAASRPRG